MLAFVLVATQFDKVRHLKVSILSVSVTAGLLVLLLIVSVLSHAA